MGIRILGTCLLIFSIISLVSAGNRVKITAQQFTDNGGSNICRWTDTQKVAVCNRIQGITDPSAYCENKNINFTDGEKSFDILICEDNGGTIFGCAYSNGRAAVVVDYIAAFDYCT